MRRKHKALSDRFWPKVSKDADGCWLWTACLNKAGYGKIGAGGGKTGWRLAHRVSYEMRHGPVPDGLELDHLCRVRRCVNPDHLEPVTQRVNLMRGVSPPAQCARKTHCDYGHEFTPENTYIWRNKMRQCRICRDRRNREWREENRV